MLKRVASLDRMFQALADPGRRSIVDRLTRGPASVSELAAPMAMSLAAVAQHLRVLEASGLVSTEKVGRVRICRLGHGGLDEEWAWLERYRRVWAARFDALEKVVEELKRKEKPDGRKK